MIVTHNLRDFLADALSPYQIEAQSPDEFLLVLLQATPHLVRDVIQRQAEQLRRPPKSVQDILTSLAVHIPRFVQAFGALDANT